MKTKLLFPVLSITSAAFSQSRPNIIFILTDDQRYDAAGFAGNNIVKTPNLDSLAKRGCIFTNAFCTTPISAASRASILTGLYERAHGYNFNTVPIKKADVESSYPAQLKKAGYRTGFIGKFGVHFESNLDTAVFDYFKDSPMDARYYYLIEGKHVHKTDFVKDQAITFLKRCKSGQPFCLSLSFNAPHAADEDPRQYIWQKEYDTLYNSITIPQPIMSDPKYFEALPEFVRNSESRVRWYWRFDTPEKYQLMVKGYYRMITGVDAAVGKITAKLKELGLDKNTIIIFCSDNGYFLGERGLADKWLMYEQSIRLPFFIYDPRSTSHPQKSDKMVLNIDVAPTILDYAGITVPSALQGMSIKPLMQGKTSNWRTEFICEHLFRTPLIPQSEGIRTADWIYFHYIQHPEVEEVYDLKNDPFEYKNHIQDEKKKKELINEMSLLLNKIRR